jgi:spore coat polysaccharide biosynthesis protein SpsF
MKTLLFCHASKKIGMGHFIRQLQVAEEMNSRGYKVTFAVSDYNPAVTLLEEKKIFYIKSKKMPFEVKPEYEADIVILDISNTDANFIKSLRKNGNKVVSFDDLGTGRDHVNILVDSNTDPSDYSKARSLFRLKYVIVNNRYSAFRSLEKVVPRKIERVAISMGGTDPKSIGPEIANFLVKSGMDFKIDLILGAGFNDKDNKPESMNFIRNNGSKCNIHRNLPDLAEILFNADIIFCAGGITLYEACAVGTPAVVISQVEHQQQKALRVQNRGAAVNMGMWRDDVLAKLVPTINFLDSSKRKQMSIAGKRMVDGKGLQRVVNEIEKL